MATYAGDWTRYEDVDYDDPPSEQDLVYARYDGGSYDGQGMLVFVGEGGTLWEVHGGHCSCYSMRESWGTPERTTIEALFLRKEPELHVAIIAWARGRVEGLPATMRVEPQAVRAIHLRH